MSSSEKQLECFVCGQSTRNRCSSCAKAGLDIAFCSTEHQKLVWPVHKLVCGPGKARPFRHPTLNDAELEILRNPACQEELNSMAIISFRNLHHLNSWIGSLSPDPFMQSEFYRVLRSMIGTFRCGTGLTSAPYLLSAFWEAAEMEVEIWKIPPCTGLTEGITGLENRLAPVLHLAVIWNAVVQLVLTTPETDAPVIPHGTLIGQLERLLQSFADISPAPTLDRLTASLSTIAATLLTLPPLEHYRISYTPLSQEPPSVRVEITRCA